MRTDVAKLTSEFLATFSYDRVWNTFKIIKYIKIHTNKEWYNNKIKIKWKHKPLSGGSVGSGGEDDDDDDDDDDNDNNNKDSLQKNSCTRNISHCKENATIRNLKPEWWGSPLVQKEKCQEKPVKRE
jgi:hypothetical protein